MNRPQNYDEIVFALVAGSIALIALAAFIIAFILLYQKRRRSYINEMKNTKLIFSQTLLQSQLEIQEQTLQHISNELHDNIAQVASIIKINLHTIKLNDPEKAEQKLEDTRELTKQLIGDIKALSVHFSGDRITRIGLSKALETEIERINKTELFTASFEKDGNFMPLDNDKDIILYRMVQEILNNIVKHSNAKEVKLKLFSNENLITLAVSDDGSGFDVNDELKNGTGAGLQNLKKRAALINATLTIKSSIGDGTNVTIELPYNNAPKTQDKTSFG
jgi:two-component system NarL family sensor kinase